eukprot:3013235-Alexandrium_andersonii.AAC.1
MSASLVGSEMCIRDRCATAAVGCFPRSRHFCGGVCRWLGSDRVAAPTGGLVCARRLAFLLQRALRYSGCGCSAL